ncbi:MAG TPA: DUF6599 family protein [Candidatus Dormibacteraeota bacterium]|nr:DUF6599 family protein [Candidatus Dormibacteraeota bacterium]
MRTFACIFVLLFFPAALRAEALPMQFAKWTASGPSARIGAAAVDQLSSSDAAVLREDGLLDAERRAYERGGHAIHVTLYRMRDSSGAYAAFTALRTVDMVASDLAPFSAIGRNRALFVIGQQLLDVASLEGASPADVRALVANVDARAEKTPYPTLSSYLPVRGKVLNSEKYFLGPVGLQSAVGSSSSGALPIGDWLGFAVGAEAALGRYRSGGIDSLLLLVEYPTPQVAAEKLKKIETQFANNSTERPLLIARRKASLLSMVLSPNNAETANALLDEVRYQTQVTWNEPTYQFKEPGLSVMIVEAFVGTGVILVFALIAGLGFGGLRLLTKYFLPGKVFDRQKHVEILQLGISSKPIEGRDFY